MNPCAWSVLALMFLLSEAAAALPAGNISLASTSMARVVPVTVAPPGTNIHWVRLSQDPDFNRSNAVRITVAHLHTNLDYADLHITYPNGVPGGRGRAAGLPNFTNHVRVLVVPVHLSDGAELPTYATNGWFRRLMFNETNGPDARKTLNSVRRYFEQNSYGRIQITGDVYPHWVSVRSAREYTSPPSYWNIPTQYVEDTVQAIETESPGFFDNGRYDFIITLHPGELIATYNSHYEQGGGTFGDGPGHHLGYLNMDLPIEPASRFHDPITNEINAVGASNLVRTAFRPFTILGVWLAGDTNHAGTNYFTGGSFDSTRYDLTLGTSLPPGTPVRVDYTVRVIYSRTPGAAFFSDSDVSVWYGVFLHEFAHGLGTLVTFTDTFFIGDLHVYPDLMRQYGLMSGGNHNTLAEGAVSWNEPAYFDAYTRAALGIVQPYELRFGENETNLRLYAAAEFPYTDRTKIIKVPLRRDGVFGRERHATTDFAGEEYLLVELRKKRPVPGLHNFDRALPSEGVLIYHVMESEKQYSGASWANFVRVLDATPEPVGLAPILRFSPYAGEQASLDRTPAAFGFDSGRFEYIHSAPWQNVGNSNLTFRLEGYGSLTLYAQFRDYTYINESAIASATTFYAAPFPDQNTNDINDNWELQYFGSLTNANGAPHADPDRDGLSNWGEFRAATNPTNALSCLSVAVLPDGTVQVRVDSGVRVDIEHTRDLDTPRWVKSYSNIQPSRTRYYRAVIPEQ